jgi:hypothetical protein
MAQAQRIVIAFGRFNPPTTGHEALIKFLQDTGRRVQGDVRVYPSPSQDPKKNPLPFNEKVRFMRHFFPRVGINDKPAIRTPIDAFKDVSIAGYREVYVVVGSDRVADFAKFAQYLVPPDSPKYNASKHIPMDKYTVVPVPGNRDPDADDVAGMSASKLRGFAIAGDFASFKQGVPSPVYAEQLYRTLRRYMHLR